MWSCGSTVAPGMPSDASQCVESRFGENHLIRRYRHELSSEEVGTADNLRHTAVEA